MSQPGPKATTWALTEVSVDGDVLTAHFRVRSPTGKRASTWLPIERIHMIDDAGAISYRLLLGEDGQHLASAAHSNSLRIEAGHDTPVWMKFPAPPTSSQTVSITLPKVGTFDGVPIDR